MATKLRFQITYKNADDDSFAEVTHKRIRSEAITTAKVYILSEFFRFDRKLNAEIIDELHPEKQPLIYKLSDILI